MKQLFLSATLCCAVFCVANAQTDSGTLLLGGGISFETSDDIRIFRASPNVGIFIMNDVAAIATFSLFSSKNTTSWAVGPTLRLYLFGSDKGKFITQVGVNFGGSKDTETDFGFEAGAGWAAFLNESIALDFLARYTKTGDVEGIFSLGIGFQIHYDK